MNEENSLPAILAKQKSENCIKVVKNQADDETLENNGQNLPGAACHEDSLRFGHTLPIITHHYYKGEPSQAKLDRVRMYSYSYYPPISRPGDKSVSSNPSNTAYIVRKAN